MLAWQKSYFILCFCRISTLDLKSPPHGSAPLFFAVCKSNSNRPFIPLKIIYICDLTIHCFICPQCCACGLVWSAGPTTTPTPPWPGKKHAPGVRRATQTWWPSRTRRRFSISTPCCLKEKTTTGSASARWKTSGPGWAPTRFWQKKQPTGQRMNQTMAVKEGKQNQMRTVWRCTLKGTQSRASGMTRGAPNWRPLCATQVSGRILELSEHHGFTFFFF